MFEGRVDFYGKRCFQRVDSYSKGSDFVTSRALRQIVVRKKFTGKGQVVGQIFNMEK